MHPLVIQLSTIVALLVLLNQLWSTASLESTLVVSGITGLAVYGVLLAGQVTLRYILTQEKPAAKPSATKSSDTKPTAGADAAASGPSATS